MMNKRGFALLFVLNVVSILLLISISYITVTSNELRMAVRTHDSMQAYYLAEAGIAKTIYMFKSNNTVRSVNDASFVGVPGGSYKASVERVGNTRPYTYMIKSKGRYHNIEKEIDLTIREVPLTRYLTFVDNERVTDPSLGGGWFQNWYFTGDLFVGPVHSNDGLHIQGTPIFDGPVTSVGSEIIYLDGGGPPTDNPDFRKGYTPNTLNITLPNEDSILNPIKFAASSDPHNWSLTGYTTITLLANGTMGVKNENKYPKAIYGNEPVIVPLPEKKAIYVNSRNKDEIVILHGVLNGQLTIGTNRNIILDGDVRYVEDPLEDVNSDNILGLVAKEYVYVSYPYSTSTPDAYINAYIVSLNGTLILWQVGASPGNGVLRLVGGMTAKYPSTAIAMPGEYGWYKRDFEYDQRLTTLFPPYFSSSPLRDKVGILYVKTKWEEVKEAKY